MRAQIASETSHVPIPRASAQSFVVMLLGLGLLFMALAARNCCAEIRVENIDLGEVLVTVSRPRAIRWTVVRVDRSNNGGPFVPVARQRIRREITFIDTVPAQGEYTYRSRIGQRRQLATIYAEGSAEVAPVSQPQQSTPPLTITTVQVNKAPNSCPEETRQRLFDLTNSARVASGLSPLLPNESLTVAGALHSQSMSLSQRADHSGWLTEFATAGYPGSGKAQNVVGPVESAEVAISALLSSPPHTSNILRESARYLGVGCAVDPTGGLWWTQNFGW